MHVPPWLTLGIAVLVIAFGLYRIRLSLKKADPEQKKANLMGGGFYRMNPRTHLLIGVVYLLLGGSLIATSFGWNPLGGFGSKEAPPPPAKKAPAGGIEMSR